MKNNITKKSIEFLGKKWKAGWFHGYSASSDIISNLKKLGIIDKKSECGMYFINREIYCKLTSGEQKTLPIN